MSSIALVLSAFAILISATTTWLTFFRRGTVKMTQPTLIYVGRDAPGSRPDKPPPKVYLRTLLFATSKRGRVLENMYVAVSRDETQQNFNIWVYGEREKLVRGSGLFVGESGVAANHHFLTPPDVTAFTFTAGRYRFDVFAHILGDRNRKLLFSQTLEVTRELAVQLEEPDTGLYFDWGPDAGRYLPHIEKRAPSPDPENILDMLGLSRRPAGVDSPDSTD